MPERTYPTIALLAGIAVGIWVQHWCTARLVDNVHGEADAPNVAELLVERARSNGHATPAEHLEAAAAGDEGAD